MGWGGVGVGCGAVRCGVVWWGRGSAKGASVRVDEYTRTRPRTRTHMRTRTRTYTYARARARAPGELTAGLPSAALTHPLSSKMTLSIGKRLL